MAKKKVPPPAVPEESPNTFTKVTPYRKPNHFTKNDLRNFEEIQLALGGIYELGRLDPPFEHSAIQALVSILLGRLEEMDADADLHERFGAMDEEGVQ